MSDSKSELRELPRGWVWVKVSDIIDPVDKVNPKEEPDYEFIYLDISSVDNTVQRITEPKRFAGREAPSRARQLVKAGDTLFSTVRTYLKNIVMVDEMYDGQVASTGFCVIRPAQPISQKFVFLFAQTDDFVNPLSDLQRGTSYPAVRDSDLFEQSFPLPPLAEQQRIVAKIEELFTQLDAGVAVLQRVKAQLQRYRQSVLKDAFEGHLTAAWREAHKDELEPASALLERIRAEREQEGKKVNLPPLDTSELPDLPEGWGWTNIETIGEVSGGLTKNRKRAGLPLKLPYLRVANVYAAELRLGDVEEIGLSDSELDRVLLNTRDLLIVEGNGSLDQIGRVALWDGSIAPCVHQNHIIKVRLDLVEMGEFVLFWLLSVGGRAAITKVASSTSGLYTLSLSKIASLVVPIAPLAEQQQIVAEIDRLFSIADEVEKAIDKGLREAERLRQSILKRAFEGKLVPQDPNDEPAEVLLARIRAAREGAPEQLKLPERASKASSTVSE